MPDIPLVSTSEPPSGVSDAGESGAFCQLYRPNRECLLLMIQSPRKFNWLSSSFCTGVPETFNAPGVLVTGMYGKKFLATELIRLAGMRLPAKGSRVFVAGSKVRGSLIGGSPLKSPPSRVCVG